MDKFKAENLIAIDNRLVFYGSRKDNGNYYELICPDASVEAQKSKAADGVVYENNVFKYNKESIIKSLEILRQFLKQHSK